MNEETVIVQFFPYKNAWIDGYCPDCHNSGKIPVCGWCEEGVNHSHCDDTWERPCGCKSYDHKHRFNNGGLWLKKQDNMWYVCLDFVDYATTKYQQGSLDKESAIKYLEAQLDQRRKQVKEDLARWSEEDRMNFYAWSRGERRGL